MIVEYNITINYSTGDSFGNEDAVDEVGCSWTNLEQAKKALAAIKEHYEAREKWEQLTRDQSEQFVTALKSTTSWFYAEDEYMWRHVLVVEKDDGSPQVISAFWCGYFERLYSAEITFEADSDMKVTF